MTTLKKISKYFSLFLNEEDRTKQKKIKSNSYFLSDHLKWEIRARQYSKIFEADIFTSSLVFLSAGLGKLTWFLIWHWKRQNMC